ncbi:MAG: peptide chain release factor N(5)-glutamine methyltransferase [Gemmatimonadaceae bacterium]
MANSVVDLLPELHLAGRTVSIVVEHLAATLSSGGISDPNRVAMDVISSLLEMPRSWPVANRDASLDTSIVRAAYEAGDRLCTGAPFAYAVGTAPFRHLTLTVDERVLIPRPETEALVGEVMDCMETRFGAEPWGTAVDVGTGSGAIALSLAAEGRFERVIGTDTSVDALAVARLNRERCRSVLEAEVEFRHGSYLAPVGRERVTLVVSNPPYIAFSEIEALPASVRDWEPPVALFSGHDGMAATAAIIRGSASILASGGLVALEVDERRASLAAELMMRHGGYTDIGVRLDLTGRERFVLASRL